MECESARIVPVTDCDHPCKTKVPDVYMLHLGVAMYAQIPSLSLPSPSRRRQRQKSRVRQGAPYPMRVSASHLGLGTTPSAIADDVWANEVRSVRGSVFARRACGPSLAPDVKMCPRAMASATLKRVLMVHRDDQGQGEPWALLQARNGRGGHRRPSAKADSRP